LKCVAMSDLYDDSKGKVDFKAISTRSPLLSSSSSMDGATKSELSDSSPAAAASKTRKESKEELRSKFAKKDIEYSESDLDHESDQESHQESDQEPKSAKRTHISNKPQPESSSPPPPQPHAPVIPPPPSSTLNMSENSDYPQHTEPLEPPTFPEPILDSCVRIIADVQDRNGTISLRRKEVLVKTGSSAPFSRAGKLVVNDELFDLDESSSSINSDSIEDSYGYLISDEIHDAIYGKVYHGKILRRSDSTEVWQMTDY